MLANKSFVRSIVNSIADMQGNSIYRRQWCDKTSVSDEERLLTFRFWNCTEANTVYEHNINEWGTKWDVTAENIERVDANTVTLSFESAWAPPVAAYARLEELGFEVEAFYYEPGMQFVGKYESGYDDCYEYGGQNSETVRDYIGEELDDYFGISESMVEYEEENEE